MNKNLLLAFFCLTILFCQNTYAQPADASVENFTSPVNSDFCPGTQAISVNIYNNDFTDITEVVLDWSINGVAQLPVTWTGLIAAGDIVSVLLDPAYDFQNGTSYLIEVTINSVNTLPDMNTANDYNSFIFNTYFVATPQFYFDGCALECLNCYSWVGDYDSVVWILNGSPDPNSIDTAYFTPTQSGNYSVIGYSAGTGCLATIDSVIPVSPPAHGITPLALTEFCAGDSVGLVFSASVQVTFTWTPGGSSGDTIYASNDGWYSVNGTYGFGCQINDSIRVTVHPLPVVAIADMNDTLVSTYSGFHQWYLDGNPIAGAHDSTYVPTQSGLYYCIVTDVHGCTGTSNTINWIFPGISIPVKVTEVMLYPNPAKDILNIRFNSSKENLVLTIYDAVGRIVIREEIFEDSTINISALDDGVYQCVFTGEGKMFSQKLVKTF